MYTETSRQEEDKMYSNLINLEEFFINLDCNEEYCVIKIPEHFPNYFEFSDLDIFCRNRTCMVNYTNGFLRQYNNIDVRTHHSKDGKHIHVDIYPNGQPLDFRFDYINTLSVYKKNTINAGFEESVLNSREIFKKVYVPSIPHEMVIRMLEYIEYKDKIPGKIKHLEYVKANYKFNTEFNNLWDAFVKESYKQKILRYVKGIF